MLNKPNRKAQIREEIKKSSRDAFILKEMKRLGMWPNDEDKPSLQEELITRRKEIQKEISDLSKKNRRYENREAELNKYKKQRLLDSREKQKLNKLKKKEAHENKQKERRESLGEDINYLGKRYSHQLKDKKCDIDVLSQHNLSHITDVKSLATTLKVSVYDLRFLCFDRKLSKQCHYISYGIKKKTGGIRKISAPKPKLKRAQRAILDEILYKLKPSEYAHGFTIQKSIVTNAKPHVGSDIVVNMDLKDFFPTIDYKRVFGFFKKIGFSSQLATILSLICTIPDYEIIKVHGAIWYLNNDQSRVLPQGAATSPMITNLICKRMDHRLAGIAQKLNFKYTRYADDLTFSGPVTSRSNINQLKWQVKSVIIDEDFVLHPKKTRVMVPGHRKEVTGIVVNEKLNISRKKLKAFRSLLYQIEKDGPKGKSWGDPKVDVLASIEGFARYIFMVNPEKGKPFMNQVSAIISKHRPKPKKVKNLNLVDKIKNTFSSKSKKSWWKFW